MNGLPKQQDCSEKTPPDKSSSSATSAVKTLRSILGMLMGRRIKSFLYDYSPIPRLLLRELCRMVTLISYRRRNYDNPEVLLSTLRIWAHIVDKGLQAEDWTPGRSSFQYKALCHSITQLKDSQLSADPSYIWALDIKTEYEEAQKHGRAIRHPSVSTPIKVTHDDLLHLIQSRRSVRSFEDRKIPLPILEELSSVLAWSATSCNRQPAKLFITQNPEKVATCMEQCAGATCFGKVIPCFIAVCADTRFYRIQDRNLPFIDVSLGLQNMLLLACAKGIRGTILNWMHHTRKEDRLLRETLGIAKHYLIVVNLIVGYSEDAVPVPGRKSKNSAFSIVD